jgi:hypothetical protein
MTTLFKKVVAPHKNISLSDGMWINLILASFCIGFVVGWIFCFEKFYNAMNYVA